LIFLAAPPPVPISEHGWLYLNQAATLGLRGVLVGVDGLDDPEQLVEWVPETVAWITWPAVVDVVRRSAQAYPSADATARGTVDRLTVAGDLLKRPNR